MDKTHALTYLITVRSLDVKKDHFRSPKEGEEYLDLEVPYLSTFNALTYLVNYTHSDIAFSVNLLARYNSASTQRNWNCVKHIFHYLC